MIEIREMKKTEYGFLSELLYEAIYFPDKDQNLPKSIIFEPHISKYFENFGRKGDFAFVLTAENDLVGAIWTRLFSAADKSYGFVDEDTPELSMAIKEGYRNRGFGNQLMVKIFEKLKASGFKKVSLSVDKRNRAVNLYRRFGFEAISEQGAAYTMLKSFEQQIMTD